LNLISENVSLDTYAIKLVRESPK